MRLSTNEIKTLKQSLAKISPTAKLYLFGSRTDDAKRGGDIDLLVESPLLSQQDLRPIRMDFYRVFGEQKIDIVLDNGDYKDPFNKLIKQQAIEL